MIYPILLVLLMASQAWADKIPDGKFSIHPSSPTYIPDCSMVDDFTPCRERNGKGWTFYLGGKKHPSLKPKPPKIEWVECMEFDIEKSSASWTFAEGWNFKDVFRPCKREIGYGKDGKVYWRKPKGGSK